MSEVSAEAGQRLAHARRANQLVPPLADEEVPDLAAAYAVQQEAIAAWRLEPAGWKIGATSSAVQTRLGLDGPFYGPLFAPACHPSGIALTRPVGLRGVEVEVAFRLGRDLPRRQEGYTLDEAIEAAAGVFLALEILATRQEGPLEGLRAVADFGLNHAFVHGPAIEGWRDLDLPAVHASLLIDGQRRAHGEAAVVMGGPLIALAWLATHGPGLRAGQWVSTGTLTGLEPLAGPCEIVGDFGPLGRVAAQMT
jgi:2-keto-4-pentenoate hydratase